MTLAEAPQHRTSNDYYNLTFGYNDAHKEVTRDTLYKVIKVKFLNGEAQFTAEELALLEKWLLAQGPAKMQELYLKYIIAGSPQKNARYLNSPLQLLFAKLCH